MSDKYNYISSMLLPFSMSQIQASHVTHEMQVLGVAKLDDDAENLILDFKLVSAQHQYETQSVSKEDFREVRIPYGNILSAELKTFRWPRRKLSELIIQVDSQSIIKDVPVTRPGRIVLEIAREDKKTGSRFASSIRTRTKSNQQKYR
jgi:hypothetical protein